MGNAAPGGSGPSGTHLGGALLYREEQSLGWPWPGIFLALLCAVTFASVSISFGYGMWSQLVLGRPWGHKAMPDGVLLVVGPLAMLASLLPLSTLFVRLIVLVRTESIEVQVTLFGGGFRLRRDEVHEAHLVRLGPLDVGRTQKWRRRVYRMAGSEGVELRKKDGSTVVVSSEHPQAFLRAVRAMLEPEHGR
jgi:hypothetical protein